VKNNPHNHIVKFPNRRLYCPEARRYVTLDEIAQRFSEGKSVRIIDKKTAKDLTSFVILQILTRYEENGQGRVSHADLLKYATSAPLAALSAA
jgi:polyhydroxyalkanoate synthesis repressor PhaR